MYVTILAFLVVGARALPNSELMAGRPIDFEDERSVSGNVVDAIENVCQSIKDAGLDPLYVEKKENAYELPVPVIYNSEMLIEELTSAGLSNIEIKSVNYSLISSRLSFDIEVPEINLGVGTALAKATLFDNKFGVECSGKVAVKRIRVVGQVRFNVGVISGVTVRSVKIAFTLGGIDSNVKLVFQDEDYSYQMNEFLGTIIPDTLKAYSSEINELLEIVLKDVINEYLKKEKVKSIN